MIKVTALTDSYKNDFVKLFTDYYTELGCGEDIPHLIEEYILPDLLSGLIKADILFDSETCAGFVIYQKDDIDNEWNFKEGWGDIREIYIAPESRGKGYGKFLLYTAEFRLKEAGTDKAYCLPSEEASGFFYACGYSETEEYNEDLDCPVYTKSPLENGCGK